MLDEDRIPSAWYNIAADLPEPPPPPLHPGHRPADRPGRPRAALPDGADQAGRQHRARDRDPRSGARRLRALPTPPLYRAHRLETALDTPAHIYYKYEGVSPSGSHKPNTAIAQAFYNKQEGVTRLATETGAGQWGSALAFAGSVFGLEVKVFMVRASYDQKPYRRDPDGDVRRAGRAQPQPGHAATAAACWPTRRTTPGRSASPSARRSRTRSPTRDTKYSLGSVFDFVLLHQTVIGQEAIEQMAMAGEEPDVLIACAGGGSNFAGPGVPVHRPPASRRGGTTGSSRSSRGGAVADPWRVHVRLRRHGRDGAAGQDAHARPQLRAAADPRRRAALPRHGAAGRSSSRRVVEARASARRDLRGRRPVRARRGHRAGARVEPRDPGGHRRGTRRRGGAARLA